MEYAQRINELENEGLTTSDAQSVADAEGMEGTFSEYTATYSPDDNKIRLTCAHRLDAETYKIVRDAGFIWAPKQGQFVAPMWTPEREALVIKLAGEIGDEDTTLLDRAEVRAERFENYSEKREREAERTYSGVKGISDNIPFGQPILIGHHSERRARKDAQKIENGMKRAVKLWETSEYWEQRAAGALAHAKYKELPAVRARRIKGIEADKRRKEREKADNEKALALWTNPELTLEKAQILAGYSCYGLRVAIDAEGHSWSAWDVLRPEEERYKNCPIWTLAEVVEVARKVYPRHIEHANKWINHYNNRLAYEKAMLNEQGAAHLIEKKARPKQLPICNYKQESFVIPAMYRRGETETLPQIELTTEQYMHINEDCRATRIVDNSHRIRIAIVSFNEDGTIRRFAGYQGKRHAVFLTDSKIHAKPAAIEPEPPQPPAPRQDYTPRSPEPVNNKLETARQIAKEGVQVVTAPQLFPTPAALARRVVEEAQIKAGDSVLEPSAGTGALLEAVDDLGLAGYCKAVEISRPLADILAARFKGWTVNSRDFLDMQPDMLDTFDKIIMNPPFTNQQDIDHVTHALQFLKAGGRLVAIMSAGSEFRSDRKAQEFRELVERKGGVFERLPEGSFTESGTNVNCVMVTIDN